MIGCDAHTIQAYSAAVIALTAVVALLTHLLTRCHREAEKRQSRPPRRRKPK